MAITGGFGSTLDLQTGKSRQWYMRGDGIKRWADNDAPCDAQLLHNGKIICPDCDGKREIEILFGAGACKCHACNGDGAVWPDEYAAYDEARSTR